MVLCVCGFRVYVHGFVVGVSETIGEALYFWFFSSWRVPFFIFVGWLQFFGWGFVFKVIIYVDASDEFLHVFSCRGTVFLELGDVAEAFGEEFGFSFCEDVVRQVGDRI